MILELTGIRVPLGHFALQVSVTFEIGITGISGPSGSGKTSLLETIAGLRRPVSGRMVQNGVTLVDAEKGRFLPAWRRRMGYVPQDHGLFSHLNVQQNLACSAGFSGHPSDSALASQVIELLELAPLLTRRTALLSGGEKARVALGRALMSRPSLLLLDEPMAHLDDRLRDRALGYLRQCAEEWGLPILMVSHSSQELSALCSRILRMEQGLLT